MQMAMLAVLVFPLTILVFTGISVGVAGLRHVQHLEPRAARPLGDPLRLHLRHRQQRVGVRRHLGQHASGTTPRIGIAMLIGRFMIIVPMLALAGSLGAQDARAAVARHLSR